MATVFAIDYTISQPRYMDCWIDPELQHQSFNIAVELDGEPSENRAILDSIEDAVKSVGDIYTCHHMKQGVSATLMRDNRECRPGRYLIYVSSEAGVEIYDKVIAALEARFGEALRA